MRSEKTTLKLTGINRNACNVMLNGEEYAEASGLRGVALAKAIKRADALRSEYSGTGELDRLCERWQNS